MNVDVALVVVVVDHVQVHDHVHDEGRPL